MSRQSKSRARGVLSVKTKISVGFSIVLALHVSIAILGHYGLRKAKRDLETYKQLHHLVEKFDAIDRTVGELQRNVLLFAFTGYQGPEVRAKLLHDELEDLLTQAEQQTIPANGHDALDEMKERLKAHREIFAAVVVDRAKRRSLVTDVLTGFSDEFDDGIRLLSDEVPGLVDDVALVEAQFRAAELDTTQFINAPDSIHVREAKVSLAQAKQHLLILADADNSPATAGFQRTLAAIDGYESALIQMVQATRGYLHLVNVVLAGESNEFHRLASDARTQRSNHVRELAETMASDSHRFQVASNIFSAITIVLGIFAAWLIGRSVAPPLNAITHTFVELAKGKTCETIPGLGRRDELGHLASAAQVFKDKAAETERLLRVAESSREELNELNKRLATQTALAESMAEEATAATMAKSEFLANMSHEIRTPMTAILGFADTLRESIPEGEENTAALDTIRRNGEHLLSIINDILDLSKVEAGKMTVERIRMSPWELVTEVISLVRVKAEAAGLLLETEFAGPVPEMIESDPTRLRQILINLLGNAIKFTKVGKVRLVTSYVESDEGPLLQFDVIDTGIGISEQQASTLFQPFSQADNSTTRQFGGTGLGLTISKRFAEILGGDLVLVETTPSHGSRFRVTVSTGPLEDVKLMAAPASVPAASKSPEEPTTEFKLNGRRILIAEDGLDNQRLLSFILRKAGADVHLLENGALALEAALDAEDPYDCILMDMQMPVMGGYEATRLLRKSHYSGPILALTAHAMDGDERKCIEAGCDGYLAKPINRQALLAKVHAVTEQVNIPINGLSLGSDLDTLTSSQSLPD